MKTCSTCTHAQAHTLGHREMTLCEAPQLDRDPVTGEVIIGARYVRNDPRLCGPLGEWHANRLPMARVSLFGRLAERFGPTPVRWGRTTPPPAPPRPVAVAK